MAETNKSGRCQVCGKPVLLDEDGKVRIHKGADLFNCKGSGMAPVPETIETAEEAPAVDPARIRLEELVGLMQTEKEKLAEGISKLIFNFERETGLKVEEIEVESERIYYPVNRAEKILLGGPVISVVLKPLDISEGHRRYSTRTGGE